MASIFKFSKKKKSVSDALATDSDARASSLIMNDDPLPGEAAEQEKALAEAQTTLPLPEEDPETTREISFVRDELALEEKDAVSNEETVSFDPASLSHNKNAAVEKDLFSDTDSLPELEELPPKETVASALRESDTARAQKFDDIFGHTTLAHRDEEDSTTALLMEVFSDTSKKKKKKKKKDKTKKQTELPLEESSPDAVIVDEKSLEETPPAEKGSDFSDEVPDLSETLALNDTEEISKSSSLASDGEYVAVHDGNEEKTKEFQASFSLEEVLNQIQPDTEKSAVPEMSQEVRVSDTDDPYSDTLDELEEKKEKKSVLPEEYTHVDEFDEFAEHLRNRNFKALVTSFWSFLAFLAILYLESATFSSLYHPEFLKPNGIFSTIYLLIDIQLLLLAALLIYPLIADGIKGFFRGKCTRNTVPFFMFLSSLVHAVALLVLGAEEYPLFGSLAALFAFMASLADFLDAKRVHRSFRIAGRRGQKLVSVAVGDDGAEAEAFRDQLDGEPKFFTVQKSNFVDGFFSKVNAPSKGNRSHGWALWISLLFSVAFGVFVDWKSNSPVDAFNAFAMAAALSLPLSGVFTVVLPFSHLSRKAEKRNSAILSAQAAEACAAADVVSFADKEIFPPKSVKVTTIRAYGKARIDKAILYAAMIFQKLGGPLSLVFKKTISGVCQEISEDFDFLEITADGMCAKIEGQDVFVGNKDYLLAYDFGYTKDEMDEIFESHSGKIMYMVIGSELAAKFYIRYSISKRFKKTILSLFKCGICPAVKTCDPNIDGDLFRTLLNDDNIPAGVIKTCDAMKDAPALEHCEAGIVCNSTIANLLHTFTICDSLKHVIRSNVVIQILSMLLGIGIVAFLYFIGELTRITGLFALIYQILWLIPVWIPSVTE